jgi:dipeptidyl-peptidase III
MKKLIYLPIILCYMCSCNQQEKSDMVQSNDSLENSNFKFQIEQFDDIKIMRYQIPDFEKLSLNQKKLVYYLSEAAYWGRDIIFDQNYKHNLSIRRTLEEIYKNFKGDRKSSDFSNFVIYLKKVWFSNGIHHHYSNDKFLPKFSQEYFLELIQNSPDSKFPVIGKETTEELAQRLIPYIFDENVDTKSISQDTEKDLITNSACNFYENVTQEETEQFYNSIPQKDNSKPVSLGINSKLAKKNGIVTEQTWKKGGMYNNAIEKIIYWLDKATTVAENEAQKKHINLLIEYYKTGDLSIWDEYNIAWVSDQNSLVDYVNGFIEVYGDPMGRKATWEAVVNFKNIEATKRTEIISNNAQWFENNSPIEERFKKKEVKGVSAKVITVAALGGDCYPSTPIGINLPNADWIRKDFGSKSVTMENITYAYDKASEGNGFLEEFCYHDDEIALAKKYGPLAGNLHTDLHECLGHGSGQLLPGTSSEALKNYHSPLEEARADLFALYFMMDQKMIDLGLIPSFDLAKAEYNSYIRNGLLTQLTRIAPGKNIVQAHMRSRQLIARWCFDNGKNENVIEMKTKNNKTYFVINDHLKLRQLLGKLLAEIQRIKSEGDYKSGQKLVEQYGVKVDENIHKEVLDRYKKLNLAPYGGFINPKLVPVFEGNEINDVRVEYPDDYTLQMLEYSEKYSVLPSYN